MCLAISRKEPFIAKRDIWVFKVLEGSGSQLKTPCQGTRVKLGVPIKASSPGGQCHHDYGYKGSIEDEGVHAYTTEEACQGQNIWSAYIPKGTKFWVQDDLTQVASETLVVTDSKHSGDLDYILDTILSDAPTGVGELVPGKGVTFGKHPVTGEMLGVCLKTTTSSWSSHDVPRVHTATARDEALKDLGGKENTKVLREAGAEITKNLPEGAWIPSFGELAILIIDNLIYANAALKKYGGEIINCSLWSSTRYSSQFALRMDWHGGSDWDDCQGRSNGVRWIFSDATTRRNLIKVKGLQRIKLSLGL